jgi:glucokinase
MSDPIWLVGDIGGTNARFARVSPDNGRPILASSFFCADYPDIEAAIRAYLILQELPQPGRICLAVAGPVVDGRARMTNHNWEIDTAELARRFGCETAVINDFQAQALATTALDADEVEWLAEPAGASRAPRDLGGIRLVAGPGTGFGVAALLADGTVLASEGGHIGFAPVTDHELAILSLFRTQHRRVSVERLLAGSGLANLYWANARLEGVESRLDAPEVVLGAIAGDSLCQRAVDDFVAVLGSVAGDLALTFGATGGIMLAGGMLPKMLTVLDRALLCERIRDKGRFRDYLANVPVAIVIAENPGLIGCALAARRADVTTTN